MAKNHTSDDHTRWTIFIGLLALFIASIVTAQVLASKLIPLNWPVMGVLAPAGVIAYAVTFFATDVVAEMYGERKARSLVNWGFGINFVFLALVWVAIWMPNSGVGVSQEMFEGVLAPTTNIAIASLLAYLIAQHWDVYVFHRVREYTGTSKLWLRNLASTTTSQLLDTVVFTLTAFWLIPSLTGLGHKLPAIILGGTIVGQYVVKVGIAAVDTPFVYAAVYTLEKHTTIDRHDSNRREVKSE